MSSQGFDPVRGTFTQSYGSEELDASLLMIPLVGFLPPDDPRVRGTVEAIERRLSHHGFIHRYYPHTSHSVDGIGEGEFWVIELLVSYNGSPPMFGVSIIRFRGERIARESFGMIGKGEYLYRLVPEYDSVNSEK